MTWNCEAYGDDGPTVGALCFFADVGQRTCTTHAQCRELLVAERQRVWQRMQELAAAGDQAGEHLAEEFTHPEQMLGGHRDDDRA